ncbi:gustatory and pheromone receptor 32a-like [Zophobas morio]|uniref:gustatory and pheromone receptor 32a-like n=1 Tax=Zophobas morio TaxID=2755281 RepID=UPI0030831360
MGQHALNIDSSVSELFVVSKLFGLMPIEKQKNSQVYTHSFFCIIYGIIVSTILFFGFLYLGEDVMIQYDSNTVSDASGWLDLYSGTVTQTLGMIMNCINAKKLALFFNKIVRIDKQFDLLQKQIDHTQVHVFIRAAFGIVAAEFCITLIPEYFLFIKDESILYLFCSYFPILTTGLLKVQFTTCVYIILQRTKNVEVVLEGIEKSASMRKIVVLKTSNDCFVSRVELLHGIQNDLCKLCQIINEIYGLQNFLIVLSTFAICITEIYFCYSEGLNSENFASVYFSLQWAFLQLVEMILLAFFCDSVTTQFNSLKYVISRLQLNSKNEQLNFVLKVFSLHELHRRVQFMVCGLFAFDFGMIQMLCGMISTYLIIMIQLDIATFQTKSSEHH